MENYDALILPLLKDDGIRYQANGTVKSMSLGYFRNSFREVAAAERPEHHSLYYQSLENPDYVMHFRISGTAGLAAFLVGRRDFEEQMKSGGGE